MSSTTSKSAIFRLKASTQTYDWGKKGSASLVAQLARAGVDDEFEVDEEVSYAEMWMGTHQNGPARLWDDPTTTLAGLVASSPQTYLGAKLTTGSFDDPAKFPHSTQVPFVFKVLSIAKALPLQAHPDKELAEQLHKQDNAHFVDDNHKPEIAVALEDGFRGFVGFKETEQIVESLKSVPELREAIDEDAVALFIQDQNKDSLKRVFSTLLTAKEDVVKRSVGRLVERIERQGSNAVGGDEDAAELVKTLHAQYPFDVGVLAAPFFMNLVTLKKGEAIYIGADEAHAYLEGDIIECMAVSDNVLNAAFVPPSSRNTSTFLHALTYASRPASHYSLPPQHPYKLSRTGQTTAYDPPLAEFTVLHTVLPDSRPNDIASATKEASMSKTGIVSRGDFLTLDQGAQSVKDWHGKEVLSGAAGPTIGLVTKGKVECREEGGDFVSVLLERGGVVFVKPGTEVSVQAVQGEAEVWWATCAE